MRTATNPEEGVQGAVLHELSDDHHGAALGHHPLQVDDVGMVKLTHNRRLAQEVPPLPLRVAHLQGLDGHQDLSLPRLTQVSTAHLPKLACQTGIIKNTFPFMVVNVKI